MYLIPKKYFVTSGCAISSVSGLNAFDQALMEAGIGEQNLVPVSSVIPKDAKEIPIRSLPMGAITHCVLAQMRGGAGEMIAAGIAYGNRDDGGGYIAEGYLHGTEKALWEVLASRMKEMAKLRDFEFEEVFYRTEELSIPMSHYGACVAALVFVEY